MREILFRGRTAAGIWVAGDLAFGKDGRPYIRFWGGSDANYDYKVERVDPRSVGQYTGVKDKNGRRIFEGDLCLCDRHINDTFDKKVFEIVFEPERGFYGENFNEINADEFSMCEVVGTAYEDADLLEGGQA